MSGIPTAQHEARDFNGAKIALICGDCLLAYQRDRKAGIPWPGFWDLPGGGREGNETAVECALRELHEEFSIAIPRANIVWTRLYPSSREGQPPSAFFAGRVSGAELAGIRFGSEGRRWKLMPIEEFLSRRDACPFLQTRLSDFLTQVGYPTDREADVLIADPPPIRVSALFRGRLEDDLTEFHPTHIVSLLDPSCSPDRVPKFPIGIGVFQCMFYDGDEPSESPPTQIMVRDMLEFMGVWLEQHRRSEAVRLLVHCHMGASRSTAAAIIALALLYGPGREREAFAHGLSVTTKPWPNINLLRFADELLGRNGTLLDQLLVYRARYPQRLEAYRRLNRVRNRCPNPT